MIESTMIVETPLTSALMKAADLLYSSRTIVEEALELIRTLDSGQAVAVAASSEAPTTVTVGDGRAGMMSRRWSSRSAPTTPHDIRESV